MSHFQNVEFINKVVNFFDLKEMQNVLEIGSYDVNGSSSNRNIFNAKNYLGLDVSEGPGVDRVYDGKDLSFLENCSFDIAISIECFEHNPFYKENFKDMYRLVKDGGFLIITCASRGRREHGTQRTSPNNSIASINAGWDYYRNINKSDLIKYVDEMEFEFFHFFYNKYSRDLYFIAKKGKSMSPKESSELKKLLKKETKSAMQRDPSIKRSSFSFLIDIVFKSLPLLCMYLMSDKTYQNFQIRYWSFIGIFIKKFQKSGNS